MASGVPRIDRIYEESKDKNKDFKPIQMEGFFVAPPNANGARPKIVPKFGGQVKQGRGSF